MRAGPSAAEKAEHFWAQVDRGAPDDCWPWKGPTNEDGYARGVIIEYRGPQIAGHRGAYLLTFGAIPPGLHIDHECHNRDASCAGGNGCMHRRCCNPAHLAAKTSRDNGLASHCHNANRTHCVRGHAFDPANTRVDKVGHRWCRACSRDNTRRYMLRKRATP